MNALGPCYGYLGLEDSFSITLATEKLDIKRYLTFLVDNENCLSSRADKVHGTIRNRKTTVTVKLIKNATGVCGLRLLPSPTAYK